MLTYTDNYKADAARYDGRMEYSKCGNSGIALSELTLGFWWNFGGIDAYVDSLEKVKFAFDSGITVFDLANNYGPPFGSAEETFGKIYAENFKPYRNEMVVTTKAGYNMWEGPYGVGSSRKMLMTSLEDSLRRMNLDYVDIFYSHRYDENTPLDETMQTLVDIVKQGKALYVGLSNYPVDKLIYAIKYLEDNKVHPLVYQGKYNMNFREVEAKHLDTLEKYGVGFTAFSPIAQGILTDKYLKEIPTDSRIARGHYLTKDNIPEELLAKLRQLNAMAGERGQSLAQMATAWLLANSGVTSVIIGPRTMGQLKDSLAAVHNKVFSADELMKIDSIMNGK